MCTLPINPKVSLSIGPTACDGSMIKGKKVKEMIKKLCKILMKGGGKGKNTAAVLPAMLIILRVGPINFRHV